LRGTTPSRSVKLSTHRGSAYGPSWEKENPRRNQSLDSVIAATWERKAKEGTGRGPGGSTAAGLKVAVGGKYWGVKKKDTIMA